MRIAVDVRSLMEGRQSGVEIYTTQIVRHMALAAPRTIFSAYYNAAKPVVLPPFPGNVVAKGFRYQNKLFNSLQWFLKQPRWDSLIPADVFFVPNPRLTPLSPHTPLVTVAHDVSFEQFPEFLTIKRQMWHRIVRPKQLLISSTRIIAVSEHTKEDLIRMYKIPAEKIVVIHSGVDVQPARSIDVQRVRAKYSLPRHFILSFGRQEPRKNIIGLIRAYSSIAHTVPHHLVIAGEHGWKEQDIMYTSSHSFYSDRIHHVGFIDEADKMALYAAADLFVYPSFYEGFGFPPLESLLAGTPVVTSFNSALPEVVGQWAFMIDPHNGTQLTRVLQDVLQADIRIPDEVREKIQTTYQWKDAAEKTLKVLHEAAQMH